MKTPLKTVAFSAGLKPFKNRKGEKRELCSEIKSKSKWHRLDLGFRNSMIPSARHRSLSSSMQSAARRISLISRSKRGFVERSYAVLGTKRCIVASVPSESFGEEKRRGRVSKQERRRMLEDFVERFRALNAGKFPTVSHAKKQVGGSFYVVREIIQEIEYNHRTSPKKLEKPAGWAKKDVNANTVESLVIKDGLEVGPVQLPLLSTNTENAFIEESSSHSTTEVVHSNEKIIEGNEDSRISKLISSDDHFLIEDQEKDSPSRFVERDASDAVPHQVIDIESPKKDSPLRLANDNGKDNVEDPTKFQADTSVHLKLETEIDALNTSKSIEDKSSPASAQEESDLRSNEEVSKSDNLTGDSSRTVKDDSVSPKGSSIWRNLRSLADGILNLWRKK